eukprot:Nk52_evm54s266 gene=Nk52_evmTU54s266
MDVFCRLIKKGDPDAVREAVQASPNLLQLKNKRGQTALMFAVLCDNPEVVEVLLEQPGVDLNEADSLQATPLITAVCNAYDESVSLLINASNKRKSGSGLDYGKVDGEGMTALHWAVRLSSEDSVKAILEAKVKDDKAEDSVYIPNDAGTYPIHSAASEGIPEIVRMLIDYMEKKSKIKRKGGKGGYYERAEGLLDGRGNTAVYHAMARNQYECFDTLIKLYDTVGSSENLSGGISSEEVLFRLNDDGLSLLHVACQLGDVPSRYIRSMVDVMVRVGVYEASTGKGIHLLSKDGHNALDYAKGSPDAVSGNGAAIIEILRSKGCREVKEVESYEMNRSPDMDGNNSEDEKIAEEQRRRASLEVEAELRQRKVAAAAAAASGKRRNRGGGVVKGGEGSSRDGELDEDTATMIFYGVLGGLVLLLILVIVYGTAGGPKNTSYQPPPGGAEDSDEF